MIIPVTVTVGSTVRIQTEEGIEAGPDYAMGHLTQLIAQLITRRREGLSPCRSSEVGLTLFLAPQCPVYTMNLGPVSLSLILRECDLSKPNQTIVDNLALRIAEAVSAEGPFASASMNCVTTSCSVQCGRYFGITMVVG